MQYLCLFNQLISSIDAFSICRDLASLNIVLLSIQSSFPREKFTDEDIQKFQETLNSEIQKGQNLSESKKNQYKDSLKSQIEQLCSGFNNPQSVVVIPVRRWKIYPRHILIGCIVSYLFFLIASHTPLVLGILSAFICCVIFLLGVLVLYKIIQTGFPTKKIVEDKISKIINGCNLIDKSIENTIRGLNRKF